MNLLTALGWQDFCQSLVDSTNLSFSLAPTGKPSPTQTLPSPDLDPMEQVAGSLPRGLLPGRVLRQERDLYRIATLRGERVATLAGRVRHRTLRREALPVPGDWVLARAPQGDRATIQATLPRRTSLIRRAAGGAEAQALVANLDAALVVTAPDRDLNPRRLERYLAMIRAGGVEPHLVLNKVDLFPGSAELLEALVEELSTLAPDVPVHRVSAQTGLGIAALRESVFGFGRSVALIGSSGVGKSTLCNSFLGSEEQATGAERASDGRGRHTTTRRDLLLLPKLEGVVIDTPGLRELALWEGTALDATFPELADFARGCRFRDCRHQGEPGCAVEDALDEGELEEERLLSYEKLRREVERRGKKQRKADAERARKKDRRRSPRKARTARRRDW